MSVTDFGYASSHSACNRDVDLFMENNVCTNHNWLSDTSTLQWTITPYKDDYDSVWHIYKG